MRLGITAKLFAAMTVVSVTTILAMAVSARLSFHHDFLGYLGEQEQVRLDAAVPPLAAAYAQHGSWAFLHDDADMWRQLMRPAVPEGATGTTLPALPVSDLIGAKPRFTLLDAQGRYVFGNPGFVVDSPALKRLVKVRGQVVGQLLMLPFRRVSEIGDLRFQHRQTQASLTIAALAVLLVAVVTLWLARALAAPLRRLASATHRLAARDYAVRVPVSSGSDIGQLEADFNTLAVTLERTERQRREMVADISHELRTPLAVIQGELEALKEGIRPLGAGAVDSLAAEAARLASLVNDLYDLSLVDVGAMRFHPVEFDMADLVEGVARAFHKRMAVAGVALSVDDNDEPALLVGDPMRLRQVLGNLLENAARYVPRGGHVSMTVRSEGAHVVVDVNDDGAGVPAEAMAGLFERFFRVEGSRSRQTGGAGLGLAICRGIVEAHGGSIMASRAPEGGLGIRVCLPVGQVAA